LPRTISAACRSDRCSRNCSTVIRAKRHGAVCWLPFLRKQVRKILIGVDASQHVAHLHVNIPLWVGCSCYSGGFLRHWTDCLWFQGHRCSPFGGPSPDFLPVFSSLFLYRQVRRGSPAVSRVCKNHISPNLPLLCVGARWQPV